MARRVRRVQGKIRRAGGVDIVLAHAPARGYGDEEIQSHRGFEAFLPLIDRWQPKYFIYGHIHMSYRVEHKQILHRGNTTLINACGKYTVEI